MQSYDPGQVVLIFGAIPITGFADGTMVTTQKDDEGVRAFVGSAGEAAFVESRKRSGKITFRLAETSNTNALLSAHYAAGNFAVPTELASISTGAGHFAAASKLAREPDTEHSNEMPVKEWTIICPELVSGQAPVSV